MQAYTLKQFIPETATELEFAARHAFGVVMDKEKHPDDPPQSLQASINNALGWAKIKDADIHVWGLWLDEQVVAQLFAVVEHKNENTHLMDANIQVLPDYRQKGFAGTLLSKVKEIATQDRRTMITFNTHAKVPAGSVFAERLGASVGLEETTNRLTLTRLDRDLLSTWQDVKETANDFELVFLEGDYPENLVADMAKLIMVMNTAPRGDLDQEDFTVTPEQIRQWEAYARARALTHWTYYVRHLPTGELAGYTEIFHDPEFPETLFQEGTGVVPKFRGNGLGKWLKAAMLDKVLNDCPGVRYIRTGNANSNAPMLKINRALGFEPYLSVTVWQLKREQLESYLNKK